MEQDFAGGRIAAECLQLESQIGDHVPMIFKSRLVVSFVALALATTACGGDGESEEDRAALVERVQRLTSNRSVAECVADEFDGEYTIEDIDTYIAARGDLTGVNFQLVEDMSTATRKCTESDE